MVDSWTEEQKEHYAKEMEVNKEINLPINEGVKLSGEMISFEKKEKTVNEEKYVPHVIEPSFGIGRITYCVFEHCFKVRESDAKRTYFDFPLSVAPVKCSILPLMN